MSELANYQKCPNCGRLNDVSAFVSNQKVSCHFCGIRFVVHRSEPGAELPQPPPLTKEDMDLLKKKPEIQGYEIYSVIGYGGMGVIYLARQSSLQRDVAVKVLSEKWSNNEVILRRFHREAAALASLSHPNIITIIDKGEINSQLYFVMEYIKGKSLRSVINRAPVDAETFAGYIIQVCRGLAHAHENGFVHRDLKPENLLLDAEGNLKIADFGLAALVDPELTSDHMTKSRMAMGTMSYMAPEQQKNAKGVDLRADIYSLGVIMYEMMTRTLPLGAYRPPSKVHPDADPRFDDMIFRCLSPDPKERPQSAEAVKEIIRSTLEEPKNPFEKLTQTNQNLPEIPQTITYRRQRKPKGFRLLNSKEAQLILLGYAVLMTLIILILAFK